MADFLDLPYIDTSFLPQAEQRNAHHLNVLLTALNNHVDGFESALRLFDHSLELRKEILVTSRLFDPTRMYTTWVFLAAEAAAMDVYHAGVILPALRGQIGRCPFFAAHVDAVALKRIQQLFESRFPRARRLRHAISHASDMIQTPGTWDHNFRIDAKSAWAISGLINRKIAFAHESEQITLEISEETLRALEDIKSRVFDAFRPAEALAETRRRSAQQPLAD